MKHKHSKTFAFLLSILLLFSLPCPVYATSTATHDYSDINNLPNEYSYGTLFWSDNTKIIDYSNCSYKTTDSKYRFGAKKNENIKIKITNCAVDEDGDICDALIIIDNIKIMQVAPIDNYLVTVFNDTDTLSKVGVDNIIRNNLTIDKYKNLIRFQFSTNHATADFKMTYLKAGTSNPANIKANASFIYDLDVNIGLVDNSADYKNEVLEGNEGIIIPDGEIYYNKQDGWLVDATEGKGVQTPSTPDCPIDFNVPKVLTSAVVTDELKESTYRMTYSGRKCGILYMFASPYTFELNAPEKVVSKNAVYEGETFNYEISQYVPNNYWSDVFNFIPNAGGKYKSFIISDNIDKNLIVKSDDIEITNETGKNVTDYFDISINEENALNISPQKDFINDIEFYAHKYIIKFPAYIKEGTGKISGNIINVAKTITTNNLGTETNKTNTVDTSLKYKVTINGEIDNGSMTINKGASNRLVTTTTTANHNSSTANIISFKAEHGYKVSNILIDGNEVSLDEITENNGEYSYTFNDNNIVSNIEHDIVVNTVLKDTKVIVNYIDTEGNKLTDSETINGKVRDKYSTEAKDIYGYNIKTVPDNATGTMASEQIIVNYIYELKNTSIVVKHIDKETGNALCDDEIITGKVFDEYSTSCKEFDGYKLVSNPTNATGVMSENKIEIIYYYTLNDASVVVNYIDETEKKLTDSITIEGKAFDKYTTASKSFYGYELIEVPTNATGEMIDGVITVTYIYKLKDAKVIVNYIDTEGNKLTDSEIINGKVFDEYNTESKEFKYYKLTTVPSNATGKMTEDGITVDYIYSRNENIVTINYLEKGTDKELADKVMLNYSQGDNYDVTDKTNKNIQYYTLYSINGDDTTGIIEKNKVINVYYIRNKNNIVINFIDWITKEEISPIFNKIQEQGTDYDVTSDSKRDIPYYTYYDSDGNTYGVLLADETINSYYIRNENTITIKYIDKSTEKKVADSITTKAYQGTNYDVTETANKQIDNYNLDEITGATKGLLTENVEIVVYYTIKNANVLVKYVDTEGNKLAVSETINGKVFDKYTTEEKSFYGYELTETPSNATGNMTEDGIVVEYIYKLKDTSVVVNYVDETGTKLTDSIITEGKVFDEYHTEKKNIDGYTLISIPDNAEGEMSEESITVIYVYSKNKTSVSAAPDNIPKSDKSITSPKTGSDIKFIVIAVLSVLIGIIIFIVVLRKRNTK